MKDAFDVLMITHSSLCKGYEGALKLILDIDDDDFGTLSFENAESLEDFSEKIKTMIDGVYKDRNLVVLLDLPGGSPANVSLPFINSSRKFIAGINLPFVLELMTMKKNGISWEELNIEEICEKGIVVMGGSREEKEFVLNGEFTTSPTKLNTNKPLYKKGSKREMEREYAKFLNKIY